MKLGINALAFPANFSVPQGLKLAKRSGFDCVELNVSEDGYLTPESDEDAAELLRISAENMSLELKSVCAQVLRKYPLTSEDPSVVERGLDITRKSLRLCKWLGADTLLVTPGEVSKNVPLELACERLSAALRQLAGAADEFVVHLAVQNTWQNLPLSPRQMRELVDGTGSKRIGVYMDVGDATLSGASSEKWIKTLGGRIKKVRARDVISQNGIHRFTNLLDGDVNWQEVSRALAEIGFDDTVVAEVPSYRDYPELGLKHCGEAMKRIFK